MKIENFKEKLVSLCEKEYHAQPRELTANQLHCAVSKLVMDELSPVWDKSRTAHDKARKASYLSMEFLVGRAIYNNLLCLGILDSTAEELKALGVDISEFEEVEDAALGNGGLGRLAACFLDSAATLDLPLDGYGIRYKYGLFKQGIKDGFQTETADDWQRYGDPWSVRREQETVVIHFADGDVNAVPYDTFIVAVVSCIGSTFIVLAVSYALSRLRFKMRKPMMNIALILGMFPGFMSMVAIYYILKGLGLTENPLVCLTLVYICGSGLTYYIAKGFFDTIPKSLDESAYLDGATRSQVFFRITIPLSKPIIVYTILTTFMAPWVDYIFPSMICGANYDSYTVALGMFKMLEREFIGTYYTQFAAAAVLVSIPIGALFIVMQKYYVSGVTGGAVKG